MTGSCNIEWWTMVPWWKNYGQGKTFYVSQWPLHMFISKLDIGYFWGFVVHMVRGQWHIQSLFPDIQWLSVFLEWTWWNHFEWAEVLLFHVKKAYEVINMFLNNEIQTNMEKIFILFRHLPNGNCWEKKSFEVYDWIFIGENACYMQWLVLVLVAESLWLSKFEVFDFYFSLTISQYLCW